MMGIGQIVYQAIFSFKTPHIVQVNNFKIGLIHRSVQLLIVCYIIGYAIVYKKGYQQMDIGQSSVTTKVKGVASTLDRLDLPETYRRMWDSPDYVIPPQENGAFFVMTDAVITDQQMFRKCAEPIKKSICNDTAHDHCRIGQSIGETGHGLMTGRCVQSEDHKNRSYCEITGWCPVENDDRSDRKYRPLLPHVYNFTVLIKNNIDFPKFGISRSNIPDWADDNYLQTCRQGSNSNCPTFNLGHMMEKADANFTALAFDGGVINIRINWDCDFDHDPDSCIPTYNFKQTNLRNRAGSGYNFRYANYYRDSNGTMARDLIKAYGILFVFTVDGRAGKFNIVPLLVNLGTGVALLGVATILADFLMLNCFKKRERYKQHKFLTVQDDSKKMHTVSTAPAAVNARSTNSPVSGIPAKRPRTAKSNDHAQGKSNVAVK